MMNKTKDMLKAAVATHARMLTILQDQAERESVVPTDGTQIATALYAVAIELGEMAEASWALRQTMAQLLELAKASEARAEATIRSAEPGDA